jgi:hypothetical protein
VVVVVVVVLVVVVVDGFGLVVVGAVVGAAVGGGRVGSGGEVGLDVALEPAVVVAIPGLLLVAASTRLLPLVAGSTLESVVAGPTSPAPEAVVSWRAVVTTVVDDAVRSAPVNSSQAGPQPVPWVISTKAARPSRAAVNEIADSPTRRRSRELGISPRTCCATTLPQLPRRDLTLRARAVRGGTPRGWSSGSGVGRAGPDPASAADSS